MQKVIKKQALRILYPGFMISDEPLIQKTIIVFGDSTVQHSYVRSGLIEFYSGCGTYNRTFSSVGELYPIKDMVVVENGVVKPRYILVHEDTSICCFYSNKYKLGITIIKCDKELLLEPNNKYVVIDGNFEIGGKQTKTYDLIGERSQPTLLCGTGTISKIEFLGEI